MTPQRAAAIEALDGEQATIRELTEIAGVCEGVLRGMVNPGVLEPVLVDIDRPYPRARADHHRPDLADAQQAVPTASSPPSRRASSPRSCSTG